MKKAYVKVNGKSPKSVLMRPYIAATILGAAVCAIALSVVLEKPHNTAPAEEKTVLSAPTETPLEFSSEEIETELLQTETLPIKTELPTAAAEETVLGKTNEEQTSVSVGLFGEQSLKLTKPVNAGVIKTHSAGKPVKSKTMGDWRVHNGVDLKADAGTEVKAPADGQVTKTEFSELTGFTVSIDHGSGFVSTLYNLEQTDHVKEGQKVERGEIIGVAGSTAKTELLEDPHVHLELTLDGTYVNPEEYFEP